MANKEEIYYSEKYYDDEFEYRHVILPEKIAEAIPEGRLLAEREWRGIGITMSRGWMHYGTSPSEPNILLFKREFSGGVNPRQQQEQEFNELVKQREKNH